jgi:hypothetical protein
MGATTVTTPRSAVSSTRRFVHLALIAIASIVLLVVAFVVGRSSADSTPAKPARVVQVNSQPCRVGIPC